MTNARMTSLFQHGPSLSDESKAILRGVLRDTSTPLSALEPVLKDWRALDTTLLPMDPIQSLAPLLVWSCTRPAHTKISQLHLTSKYKNATAHMPALAQVSVATQFINSLSSCLVHISDIPFSAEHNESLSSSMAYFLGATEGALALPEPPSSMATDTLHEAKNDFLLALTRLVYTRATAQWSHEDLCTSVASAAQNAWYGMPNHMTAAGAHAVLDTNLPGSAKLTMCHQLSSWAWTTHGLEDKLLPLLPVDPYERALVLPWGGKPNPVGRDQALVGVRINRELAARYVPELHDMMLLANNTIGAWRCKKHVLALLTTFAPKEAAPEYALPDLDFSP